MCSCGASRVAVNRKFARPCTPYKPLRSRRLYKPVGFVRKRLYANLRFASEAVLANLRLLSEAEQANKSFAFVSEGFVSGARSTRLLQVEDLQQGSRAPVNILFTSARPSV